VSPAAHYFCGGIKTNIDGLTNIPGLYAIGEVACTVFMEQTGWPAIHCSNRLFLPIAPQSISNAGSARSWSA